MGVCRLRETARLAAAVLMSAGLLSGPAAAVDGAAEAAGRAAIDRQLDALAVGNDPAAYAEAAPAIRGIFPSDTVFGEMVRRSYGPLVKPRSREFGPSRDTETGFEQILRLQDGTGTDWDALYSLERQADGSWKISGCRLVKRPGEAV